MTEVENSEISYLPRDFGFIITRHVMSEKTNNYWNQAVRMIRRVYPFKKIIVIDDNSNQAFVKADYEYKNIEIITSEYPGRGELLPYHYYSKNDWFDNAVIIHDSIFIHHRISFEKLIKNGVQVMPLWHFNADKENPESTRRIMSRLTNGYILRKTYDNNEMNILGMSASKWKGCFGVQSFINRNFLIRIQNKYNLSNMISEVTCRSDRCCLERIMGIIFHVEYLGLLNTRSLFGNIFEYTRWGYSYDEYIHDGIHKKKTKPFVKVWTGR